MYVLKIAQLSIVRLVSFTRIFKHTLNGIVELVPDTLFKSLEEKTYFRKYKLCFAPVFQIVFCVCFTRIFNHKYVDIQRNRCTFSTTHRRTFWSLLNCCTMKLYITVFIQVYVNACLSKAWT